MSQNRRLFRERTHNCNHCHWRLLIKKAVEVFAQWSPESLQRGKFQDLPQAALMLNHPQWQFFLRVFSWSFPCCKCSPLSLPLASGWRPHPASCHLRLPCSRPSNASATGLLSSQVLQPLTAFPLSGLSCPAGRAKNWARPVGRNLNSAKQIGKDTNTFWRQQTASAVNSMTNYITMLCRCSNNNYTTSITHSSKEY